MRPYTRPQYFVVQHNRDKFVGVLVVQAIKKQTDFWLVPSSLLGHIGQTARNLRLGSANFTSNSSTTQLVYTTTFYTFQIDSKMSFQAVSERLSTLQESNEQLKILIDRLATIKFQPGSVPLGDEEDNVMGELTAEIQQTIKDQDEDFELLQEEVLDLDTGRRGSELEHQRDSLAQSVKRAVKELKT